MLRAGGGWSGDVLIADCEDLETLSASDIHVKRFKHQKLLFPCADGILELVDLLQPPRGEMPLPKAKTREDENEEGDTFFSNKKMVNMCGA